MGVPVGSVPRVACLVYLTCPSFLSTGFAKHTSMKEPSRFAPEKGKHICHNINREITSFESTYAAYVFLLRSMCYF